MEYLSKKQEKLIRSLSQKKFRLEHELFVVEGEKLIHEAMKSKAELELIAIEEKKQFPFGNHPSVSLVDSKTMSKISNMTAAPGCLAVIKTPSFKPKSDAQLTLALHDIKDPGNMGTIIRSADAFGVNQIVCSKECVDIYNPKVVQATMGSVFHLPIIQTDLEDYLKQNIKGAHTYGLHLNGTSIYETSIEYPSIIIMGNESKGISDQLDSIIDNRLKIPMRGEAESLNVSMATSVILAEIQRQALSQ